MMYSSLPILAACLTALSTVAAYDGSAQDNLAVYYGQNSAGAANPDPAVFQKNLSTYCADDVIDAIPLAFLNVFFSTGGLPEINLANTCNNVDNEFFDGTSLANCSFMSSDIKACQSKGKIVTLSLGGATGAAGFTSDAQAESFAQTIWDLFFEGNSSTRPFGSAVLDGIDLDIEGGGSTGFVAFVKKFQSLGADGSKKFYVTAAPQCPFPDAFLGPVLNGAEFDAVYVQFYNNFCSLPNFPGTNWNYDEWDDWAKNTSPNPDVKIFIGAPASTSAASSGFVPASQLVTIANDVKANFSSFGGVMMWDASQAFANGRYDQAVKDGVSAKKPSESSTTAKAPSRTSPPKVGQQEDDRQEVLDFRILSLLRKMLF